MRIRIARNALFLPSFLFSVLLGHFLTPSSCPADWTDKAIATAGLPAMEHLEWLPLFAPTGTETRQVISYDPTGGNMDGIYKSWIRYIDENKDWVIFDEMGPGCLYRQQMNVWVIWDWKQKTKPPMRPDARIKYYFDDERTPRIDMTFDEFFGKDQKYAKPFTPPLGFFDERKSKLFDGPIQDRFAVLYYPFTYQKRLRIAMTPQKDGLTNSRWFQYTLLKYPHGSPIETWPGQDCDSAAVRQQWQNVGNDPKSQIGNREVVNKVRLENGASATALDLPGQGSIASLRFDLEPYTRETFYKTTIAIYWDEQSKPAIEMPLGCFFGGGDPTFTPCADVWKNPFKSLMQGYDPQTKSFYMFWPMPYWSKARVVLTNHSGAPIEVGVRAEYKPTEVLNYPREKTGHFCARQTIETAPAGRYYSNAFEESGRGKVVGDFLFTQDYDMDGDTFVYIDDSRTPQIHGDGTEDDHNQGWGGDSYQKPLWGGLPDGYTGGYRYLLNDFYVFDKNIKINYEHSNCSGKANANQKTDAIVYYYKAADGATNLRLSDELNVGDQASEAAHRYQVTDPTWTGKLTCAYDVYEKNRKHNTAEDDGHAFTGYSEFTVKIDPNNTGVKLRRRTNRQMSHRQMAAVSVDGAKEVIPWYLCELASSPAETAWVDTDVFLPARLTQGKSQLTIRVRCVESANAKQGINEFRYWVYSYGPGPLPETSR